MIRDTVSLPGVPEGTDDALKLKRDMSVAALCLKRRIPLQEAADAVQKVVDAAEGELAKLFPKTPPPT